MGFQVLKGTENVPMTVNEQCCGQTVCGTWRNSKLPGRMSFIQPFDSVFNS